MEITWYYLTVDNTLTAAMRAVIELGEKLHSALDSGDMATAGSLHGELRAAEERRDALLADTVSAAQPPTPMALAKAAPGSTRWWKMGEPPAPGEQPVREAILDTLTFLGRPAGISLVTDVLRARGGPELPSGRLASLRRDEERSFTSSATRPSYLVPALAHDRFTPVRGMLASSAWPLPIRLIAPASGRVDFLHAVAAIAAAADRDAESGEPSPLDRVLWKLARSIPDALVGSLDPRRVRCAALAELEVHRDADEKERAAAAERARAQLSASEQLFGHRPKVIVNRRAKDA